MPRWGGGGRQAEAVRINGSARWYASGRWRVYRHKGGMGSRKGGMAGM